MFTGIVQGVGKVTSLEEGNNFKIITILFPEHLVTDLCVTYSVSINGCCLSVTQVTGCHISFHIIDETLRLTNLSLCQVGSPVNIERSVRLNSEVGGHFLSGHIIAVAHVKTIRRADNNCTMELKLNDRTLMKYIFYKGYVGVDGISLTIGEVYEDYFKVHLIPETMEKTNIKTREVGHLVNIEVDTQTQVIVNTVERVLKEHYTGLPCLCQCNIKEE